MNPLDIIDNRITKRDLVKGILLNRKKFREKPVKGAAGAIGGAYVGAEAGIQAAKLLHRKGYIKDAPARGVARTLWQARKIKPKKMLRRYLTAGLRMPTGLGLAIPAAAFVAGGHIGARVLGGKRRKSKNK